MEIRLFFSGFLVEFLGSNEKGMGWGAYIEEGTCRPRGGDRPPLSPAGEATGPPGACRLGPLVGRPWGGRQGPVARWGGRQSPSFFFPPGTLLQI